MSLEEKIEEILIELDALHLEMKLIHKDLEHTNNTSKQTTENVQRRLLLTERIWKLKQNWT